MYSIVDSHVHASPIWYEPVESLLRQLDANRVAKAVLVQQGGQFDNSYILECVRRYPDRLFAVALVDPKAADACERLRDWVAQGARGVRLHYNDRSPGDDPLAIWRQAAALRIPISCSGRTDSMIVSGFAQVVEAIPDATFIIEHMGMILPAGCDPAPYPRHREVFALARYPNVAIKFHGLAEICPRTKPFPQPFPVDRSYLALFDLAYAAFGPERMLWGSDFPPVSGREGYANALRWPQEHFATLPSEAQAMIFGGNAQRLYSRTA